MRIKVLAIGILLFMFAIIGYIESSGIINKTLGSFIAKDSPVGAETLLRQLGFPSIETITQASEYSFLTMSIVGVAVILLGGTAKKKATKKVSTKMVKEDFNMTPQIHDEVAEKPKEKIFRENLRTLEILQHRLAKGEITPAEFVNLKRYLE